MSLRIRPGKVECLLRGWGFGENVVQKFEDEEIDEEAFDCLDRRLIEILFKTVGAQAKFLKHYQAYLGDKKNSSCEVTEVKAVQIKTEKDTEDFVEEIPLDRAIYYVPDITILSPDKSPQYSQSAKRSCPFVAPAIEAAKRSAHCSNKDGNDQDKEMDWIRSPKCSFSVEKSQSAQYESCIPKSWPDYLQTPMERNSLTSTERNEIIRRIVDRMLDEELKGDIHYKAVAELAIARLPCLESNFNQLGLVKQMKACVKSKVYQSKRRSTKETETMTENREARQRPNVKLSEIVENGKPINVVIDEATGDLVLDDTEYDISEGLLVLSGDSSDKESFFCEEKGGTSPTRPSRSDLEAIVVPQGFESSWTDFSVRAQLLDSCIPKSWPENLQMAIETQSPQSLAPTQRNEIVRRIVDRMIDEGLKGDENFRDVAILASEKIPALGSKLAACSLGLVHQLKMCWKNKTKHARSRARKEAETASRQNSRTAPAISCQTRLKIFLRQCRKSRLTEARTCPPKDHLRHYPGLKDPKLILWEFEEIVHFKVDDIRARWLSALPKIEKLLGVSEAGSSYSHDRATIRILLHIEDYFSSKRKPKTAPSRKILQTYVTKNSTGCVPSENDLPCLVGIGNDKTGNLKITTYINNVPIFTGGAIDAYLLLIAIYWVFSVDFAARCRPTMTFLCAVMMPTLMANDVAKYRSVLLALEDMEKL